MDIPNNSSSQHLILRVPTEADRTSVMEYRDEFLTSQPTIHGSGSLETFDGYDTWLSNIMQDHWSPAEGRVPSTQYLAYDEEGNLVGMIQLRHDLTDYLRNHGGHIGYSVRPSERRKGYASQMLALCLHEAKQLGLKRVLVTCDESNIASRRVIEKSGGVQTASWPNPATGENTLRFWISIGQ